METIFDVSIACKKYIDTYLNNYIKPYAEFSRGDRLCEVKINGLANFVNDDDVPYLINDLKSYGIEVVLTTGDDTIEEFKVDYTLSFSSISQSFVFRIGFLPYLIMLSTKTELSLASILIMQIISMIVCKSKIMYKAIILDLDDTLWDGTLAEEGIEAIKRRLSLERSNPFLEFMRFIRDLSIELGLYIAICSRNSKEDVVTAISALDDIVFPIKGYIDCIVANYNDKSGNIKAIAKQLSVLTSACVFIDDNAIVRDEVKKNLPEVFVPEWSDHGELFNLLLTSCVFNRFELSLRSRDRKKIRMLLQLEREKTASPKYPVKIYEDISHKEANCLYAKSNQFKFSETIVDIDNSESLVFELFRESGESLGVCSTISFVKKESEVIVLNWAISCRYFEIGLEEFVLIYIINLFGKRQLRFKYCDTGNNCKAITLINKYKAGFSAEKDGYLLLTPNSQIMNKLRDNTNLYEYE